MEYVYIPLSDSAIRLLFHTNRAGAKLPRNGEEKEWLLYTKNSADISMLKLETSFQPIIIIVTASTSSVKKNCSIAENPLPG